MNGSLTWFWLALFFALWTSLLVTIIKRLTKTMNPIFILFVSGINILPFIYLLIIYLGGIPAVTPKFYLLLLVASILDAVAGIASYIAISTTPISLISPISSFNPVFTTIIAALTLHEVLNPAKLFGILIVVLGSYLLNASDIKGGLLLPFKKLFTNRGVQLFLFTNFLWAVTPIFQKQAIFETHPQMPLYAPFIENILIVPFMSFIILIKVRDKKKQMINFKKNWKWFAILAPLGALATWAAFTAFSLAPLGLVTSIFKLSVLFTIGFGFLFFKEERIWERLLGAAVMILGTILLIQ